MKYGCLCIKAAGFFKKGKAMKRNFFAFAARLKYISRWALMRNTTNENLSQHAHEVATLAHALAVLGNRRLGKHYDAARAALLGLYHDTPEIITGDMPTPVKYYSDEMRQVFSAVEKQACARLVSMLPEDMQADYTPLFFHADADAELWKLVKAADKMSAYIKCIEERKAGNTEFFDAEHSIKKALQESDCEELRLFMADFISAYELPLDQLK